MRGEPQAYEAYYPVQLGGSIAAGGPLLMILNFLRSHGARDDLIVLGLVWACLLFGWVYAAKLKPIVALRIDSAGVAIRRRVWQKKPTALPWNDIEYLVMWHDRRTTSLSVQRRGGTAQPLRVKGVGEPANYLTLKNRALDEQRLRSAMALYGPAVQLMDGNTGIPLAEAPQLMS